MQKQITKKEGTRKGFHTRLNEIFKKLREKKAPECSFCCDTIKARKRKDFITKETVEEAARMLEEYKKQMGLD